MALKIILAVAAGAIFITAVYFYFLRRYARRLEFIRDRLDLTTQNGRDIAFYVNDELDRLHGKKRKEKARPRRPPMKKN